MEEVALEEESLREVPASEILAKIEKGEPVEYDHIKVIGDLDIDELNLPKEDEKCLIPSIIIIDSVIKGAMNLQNCIFFELANFSGTKFHKSCTFSGSVSKRYEEELTQIPVQFYNTQFFESSDFSFVNFNEASFKGCVFSEWCSFDYAQFKYANFSEVKFGSSVHYLGKAHFNFYPSFIDAQFESANFSKSQFLSDVHFWGTQFTKKLHLKDARFANPRDQEALFRLAKKLSETEGDKQEADANFYREMEAKRMQKPRYIRYSEYVFIQHVFGYGVHPWWLWAWWFFFVGVFATIYWKWGGVIGATQPLDYIWFSITVAVTPGFAGYKPIPGLFQVVAGLEAIFGTFMWAAFIATFARKYMR